MICKVFASWRAFFLPYRRSTRKRQIELEARLKKKTATQTQTKRLLSFLFITRAAATI
jgi:hypothetical protein